jgi:hypothetical protein
MWCNLCKEIKKIKKYGIPHQGVRLCFHASKKYIWTPSGLSRGCKGRFSRNLRITRSEVKWSAFPDEKVKSMSVRY